MTAQDTTLIAQLPLLINRLVEVLRTEAEALRANPMADLSLYVEQKSRYHYEINLALASVDQRAIDPELSAIFRGLKEAVEHNVRALQAARGASEDVVAMLSREHRASTTDGTYSRYV